MAVVVADRVQETSTTTGTGAYTLAGAVTGFQTFASQMANGDTCTYFAYECDVNGVPTGNWEDGTGTWNTGNTLSRAVDKSSNANALVSWGAGTKRLGIGLTATALASLKAIGKNSIGGVAVAGGSGAVALGGSYASGTDSFAAANADNSGTYGAQGIGSVALGNQNKASADNSGVLSGQSNVASGFWCTVAGGNGNTATGTTTGRSFVGGGYNNNATANGSSIVGGISNTASAQLTSIGGGTSNLASAVFATIPGGSGASAAIIGKEAYASGAFSTTGDAQRAGLVLRRNATAASTGYVLTSDAGAPAATNQVVVPPSSSFTFEGSIDARQQAAGGTSSMGWKVEGLARMEATGNIVLVASTVTAIGGATAPTGWTLTCTADVTNQAIAFTFNMGATVMNVRVVGNIRTVELTYA